MYNLEKLNGICDELLDQLEYIIKNESDICSGTKYTFEYAKQQINLIKSNSNREIERLSE